MYGGDMGADERMEDMSKCEFDYCEFGYCAGDFDQLVFHAKKYTKEQAVEIFNREYAYKGLKATLDNVGEGYVKYFIRPTQQMCSDFEGGVYGFTDKPGNGAFPVWVITLAELEGQDGG